MDEKTLTAYLEHRVERASEQLSSRLGNVIAAKFPLSELGWLSTAFNRAAEVQIGNVALGMLAKGATVAAVGARALDEAFSAALFPSSGGLLERLVNDAKGQEWAELAKVCGTQPARSV